MIDLITGHQGIPHISAEQISTLHRSLMGSNGDNKVVRMKDGGVTSVGLTVSINTGYWRVHGYDMQIQEAEAVIFDPTEAGYQRIDDLFVEILQDISSGVQRSELVIVQGEPSTTTPIAPAAPTEAASEYDLLVECVPVCSVQVIEGAMTMTDLTIPFKASSGDSESLAPEFDPERPEPYEIGEIVEHEGTLYKFIAPHTGPWNDADVEETTVAALLAGKADIPVPINQGGTEATTADQARGHLGAASNTEFHYAYNMIRNSSSDAYSTTKSYKAGEYCIHGNTLYKCISPCTPGSWEVNRSHFAIDTITNALTSVNNDLNASINSNSYQTISSGQRVSQRGLVILACPAQSSTVNVGYFGLERNGVIVASSAVPAKYGYGISISCEVKPNDILSFISYVVSGTLTMKFYPYS